MMLKHTLLEWYWYNIKYRKYLHQERKFLVTFETAIQARRETEKTIYTLLRLNIERAKLLFENDFETLKDIEQEIEECGLGWTDEQKEMDVLDGIVWRKMFTYFLKTHDNETTAKVWGAPIEDIIKFRETFKKTLNKS